MGVGEVEEVGLLDPGRVDLVEGAHAGAHQRHVRPGSQGVAPHLQSTGHAVVAPQERPEPPQGPAHAQGRHGQERARRRQADPEHHVPALLAAPPADQGHEQARQAEGEQARATPRQHHGQRHHPGEEGQQHELRELLAGGLDQVGGLRAAVAPPRVVAHDLGAQGEERRGQAPAAPQAEHDQGRVVVAVDQRPGGAAEVVLLGEETQRGLGAGLVRQAPEALEHAQQGQPGGQGDRAPASPCDAEGQGEDDGGAAPAQQLPGPVAGIEVQRAVPRGTAAAEAPGQDHLVAPEAHRSLEVQLGHGVQPGPLVTQGLRGHRIDQGHPGGGERAHHCGWQGCQRCGHQEQRQAGEHQASGGVPATLQRGQRRLQPGPGDAQHGAGRDHPAHVARVDASLEHRSRGHHRDQQDREDHMERPPSAE